MKITDFSISIHCFKYISLLNKVQTVHQTTCICAHGMKMSRNIKVAFCMCYIQGVLVIMK